MKLLIPLLFLLVSCATVLKGSSETVKITSEPAQAHVYIDGVHRGNTPLSVSLPANKNAQVRVEAPGYAERTRNLQSSFSLGYALVDILFGVVPLVVDVYTSSIYSLDTSNLHFQFAPVAQPKPPTNQSGFGKFQLQVNDKPIGEDSPGESTNQCCINGASYECSSAAALAKCMPPELPACLMSCDMSSNCPEECLSKYPADPSDCSRTPEKDTTCR